MMEQKLLISPRRPLLAPEVKQLAAGAALAGGKGEFEGYAMREGSVDGLSIGFRTEKAVRDRRSGLRHLEKLDLWEVSVVTFPMLPQARVNAVKRGLPPPDGVFNRADPSALAVRRALDTAAHLLR